MNRKESGIVVVVALVAGFVGGAMSGPLFQSVLAIAQETPLRAKVIEAELITTKVLSVLKDGKQVVFLGAVGDGAQLQLDSTGGSFINMSSDGMRASLGLFWNVKHEEISHIGLSTSKSGTILSSSKGPAETIWANNNDGTAYFALTGKGKTRAVLGNTELKRTRTGVIEKRPLSSLVLFNEDGNVTWKAP